MNNQELLELLLTVVQSFLDRKTGYNQLKSTVEYIRNSFDQDAIYNFSQRHFWFYFNCRRQDIWAGNTMLSFKNFKKESVNELRNRRRGYNVSNGGWHFSFMGGYDRVKQKIENYGEQSINVPRITNNVKDFIDDCIINNHDFYNRYCKFDIIPIEYEYLPRYLVDNQDKFSEYIRSNL